MRALMARVGSLINCFHIIHLYSRKITLFLGQQSLGFNKNFPGCKESSHLRFSRLWGDLERILNPGADAWGERYGGDLKVASNYGARRILPPLFLKKDSPHLRFCATWSLWYGQLKQKYQFQIWNLEPCFEQLSGNCVAESLNWCRDQRARPFKMKIFTQEQKTCWGTVSEMRKMKNLSARCLTVRQQYLKPHAIPILLWKQLADNNLLKQTGTKNVYSGCF